LKNEENLIQILNSFLVEIELMNSSQMNGFTYLNGSTGNTNSNDGQSKSNSTEEDSDRYGIPTVVEKEAPKLLSKNVSTSTSMPAVKGEIVSFHSLVENTNISPEHIYENVPIVIQMASNKNFYYNVPIASKTDQPQSSSYLSVTIKDDRQSEVQKQYLSQLFGEQNGVSLLLPQQSIKQNPSTGVQETSSINPPQQVLFANHLTNPLFNIDKQLLANTIANQFGVDLNSPHLQQLIQNQHLFAAHKRTFANMIWQMTTEEENALCSSPISTKSSILDINTVDSNSSTAKPILKANNTLRSIAKKQRITWDSALE
jgi:hypothetical protein